MNLKVCGVKSMKQLRQLDALNVDYAGLIFDNDGFGDTDIDTDAVHEADLDIKLVGIFSNADYEDIMAGVENFGLGAVQLNGDESPFLCEKVSGEIEVIKTFRIENSDKLIDYKVIEYDEACDYYLFKPAPNLTNHSLKVIEKSKIEKPFFLSGSFVPSDGKDIKKFNHPDFLGIDLDGENPDAPGIQNIPKLLAFLQSLKPKR